MNDPRISFEIQKILPHLRKTKKILNINCGDGKLISLLNNILEFEYVFVTDPDQMCVFKTVMSTPSLNFGGYHYTVLDEIPELTNVDTVLYNGIIRYSDLNKYKNKIFIQKWALDEEILNEHQEKLKKTFSYVKKERLYPRILEDDLRNTYLFICFSKNQS